MAQHRAFAAIDLGSTKIATVVGDVSERGMLRVLGAGVVPSAGVEKGQISHIARATEAIRGSLDKAERASGTRVLSAAVGVSGAHLACLNNRGIVAVPSPDRPINADDMQRVIDTARTVSLKSNREVLHAIPRYYVVDGQDRVSDPEGMHGQRLDVEMHLVTGAVNALQNVTKCVEGAGVQVEALLAMPVATAAAVLRPEEMAEGAVLVDIGGGTTDVAVYLDGAIIHTASLPIGGAHVTRDMVVGLRCPFSVAEEIKIAHGDVSIGGGADGAPVTVHAFGEERERQVEVWLLREIIAARVEEILALALGEVKRAGHAELISAGLVLSGGTASLPGITALAEALTGLPARVGTVEGTYGLTDQVSGPAYAGVLGLVRWLAEERTPADAPVRLRVPRAPSALGLVRRVGQWGRVFLPQ